MYRGCLHTKSFSAYASPSLDIRVYGSEKVSGAFQKRAPGLEPIKSFRSRTIGLVASRDRIFPQLKLGNTPNANMTDHSVIARDELHESEASEASVFCFDNASAEKF